MRSSRTGRPTRPFSSTALVLAALLLPSIAAAPVCVEQALNEFENDGACALGDGTCYCTSSNQSKLMSNMDETCVNNPTAQQSLEYYVSSFCQSMTGAAGSGQTSSSYPVTTSAYPNSSSSSSSSSSMYPTSPMGQSYPTSSYPTGSATATPSLLPSATPTTSYSLATMPSSSATYPVSSYANSSASYSMPAASPSTGGVPTDTITPAPSPTSATSAASAVRASLNLVFGLALGACGAAVLGAVY